VITIEGLKKMESKMLSQAELEAKKILSSSKEEVNKIKDENKKRLDSFSNIQKEKIESEIKLLVTKELASAQMEGRKIFLDEREIIIKDIIENALSKIREDKAYTTFIEKNLKEFSSSLGKQFDVLCNKKDIDVIKKIATKLKIDVNVKEHNVSSGMILMGSGLKVNLAIETLFEEKERQIRQKILEIIEK
jgi:V/A-type H+/Na+-transporting ATPase subunit E